MTSPGGTALEANGIRKAYGTVEALDGVSFSVGAGECVALVGESGSGKTTLLRCFNRMVVPDGGKVMVGGVDVAEVDPVPLRRSIGYVPQEGGLLPHWTVRRNVELVPWLTRREDRGALAAAALAMVGLPVDQFGARWPRDLSGGQRQRVAIARALACHPGVLLLDEPFGALDAITRGELQDAFAALRRQVRVTTLLVTHDMREALLLADRIIVLYRGAIEQVAGPRDLLDRPATPYVRQLLDRAHLERFDA